MSVVSEVAEEELELSDSDSDSDFGKKKKKFSSKKKRKKRPGIEEQNFAPSTYPCSAWLNRSRCPCRLSTRTNSDPFVSCIAEIPVTPDIERIRFSTRGKGPINYAEQDVSDEV